MGKTLLLIGIGGAAGSVCRYVLGAYVARQLALAFPLGTMLVNLSGCLLIGVLYGLAARHAWLTLEWRLFLITGICGGYTTFSSFSYESILLVRQAQYGYFFLYVIGSVVLGLLATAGGYWIAK